jgi:hypothetical protein
VSALTAAMAEVLETHQQTLDLTDDNARVERIAYQQLADDCPASRPSFVRPPIACWDIGIFRWPGTD